MIIIKNNYYVYRFLDSENTIIYVGRTINLQRRFLNHEHLSDSVKKIEYIRCQTEADMIWKEIYYINLFFSEKSTNIQDVYSGGVTDILLDDKWALYKKGNNNRQNDSEERLKITEINNLYDGYNVKSLIHICNNEKLNEIGSKKYSLSKKWFYDANQEELKRLKNNLNNYFRHITKSKSSDDIWTTYDEIYPLIQGKGYTKGFVSLDSIVDDKFSNRTMLAFIANSFLPVNKHNVTVDEDGFALSEMLQFIWRSAIRDKNEIYVYVPSVRMRNLLKKWIEENS